MGNNIVSTGFTYDIQNRLRMINNPSSLGTKPFAMELQYNAPNVSGATAQYSGNISAVRWRHNGGSEQSYRYSYDSYNRLTDGIHSGSNNEQGITYDSNGNITALTRTGIQPAAMTYNYSGNRLSSIVKGGTTHTYAHDSNGNVTTDGIRGMTITYNYLNLPKSVAKGTDNLEFIYDATGVKLATKQNGTTQNYYTGAVVYKSDKTPEYILTSSGMIRKDGAEYIRQYNITDHLGNVRSVVNQSGTIEQATDYYPYGLSFSDNNLNKNRYLYNGKELQNQTLSSQFFGMYDYGARYYDPVIGRWMGVDPAAELYYSWSTYQYVRNNPILRIDPNGMWDDYYSSLNGKKLGSDGASTTNMRLIDDDKFNEISSANGGATSAAATTELQNSSKIITVNEAQIQSDVQGVADNSKTSKTEHSVVIVLDRANATISTVAGPTGTNDQCNVEYYPGKATGASFHGKPGGSIIIGQVHGHPESTDPNTTTQRTMSGNDVSVSTSLQIPVYGVDAMSGKVGKSAGIHRANPDGSINNNIGLTIGTGKYQTTPTINLGRNAMEIWGNSKKPTY